MEFPSPADFLEIFGLAPLEEDANTAYCRYVKRSADGRTEMDLSFSAVATSFQVVVRCDGHELVTISSEKTRFIKLRSDSAGACVRAVFDLHGVQSEALVTLAPELQCRWWTLRTL